ncbi:substrate-binding domain-containing protein [Salipiger sp.]|uniref:substrate-binding domain-containing protein n=1 Tax=Salipiger sp. TaxID=2078585 RepID=UPI003A97AB79
MPGEEIKVMSSGSADPALGQVARAFEAATGHKVNVTYDDKIIGEGGEAFDVIISSTNALARRFRPAGAVETGEVPIGRMGLGVAVRDGAPLPDVSGLEAFKGSLRALDGLVLTTHSSGFYMRDLLEEWGMGVEMSEKIEFFPDGPTSMQRLLKGTGRECTVLSLNQIQRYRGRGIALAGPLPEGAQLFRDFVAVPLIASRHKSVARAFSEFCGAEGLPILAEAGFQ